MLIVILIKIKLKIMITISDTVFCPCPGASGAPHGIAFALVNLATQVFINNSAIVCAGDEYLCSDGTKSAIIQGSLKIFINGKPVALFGSCTDHGGKINSDFFGDKVCLN